ncbi:MAG: non-canonical purine NTP pyrophosphatase [Candidatus Binatia bacterium]|nr:MAG: non-canonical purine NTP pyrophosphatase [Candidatus Binatia bacterium]
MNSASHRPKLVLATANPGKVKELRELLAPAGVECISLEGLHGVPVVEETGRTYEENAALKARAIAAWAGLAALADDSGLEVDALEGAPGVDSAYYAGRPADDAANVAKLLRALEGVPPERRQARFRCVLVVVRPDGKVLASEGICEGRIALAPRGQQGFGYDPIFIPEGSDKTFAELGPEFKRHYSHRARAARKLRERLRNFLTEQCVTAD